MHNARHSRQLALSFSADPFYISYDHAHLSKHQSYTRCLMPNMDSSCHLMVDFHDSYYDPSSFPKK